ncbi:MAG: hypothetical protein KDJ65_09970 [Anaerolineae bacterium]|nr:hypothetical protein [Anaerolineae bacterium]
MSDYLQLENRVLKLELKVLELEKQLAQAGGSNGSQPSLPSPVSPNVVPPAGGSASTPTDEEIRTYQKVRRFMDFLGNCR